jgi:hypothetical protein
MATNAGRPAALARDRHIGLTTFTQDGKAVATPEPRAQHIEIVARVGA